MFNNLFTRQDKEGERERERKEMHEKEMEERQACERMKLVEAERLRVKVIAPLDEVALGTAKAKLVSALLSCKKREFVCQFAKYYNTRAFCRDIYGTLWKDLHDILYKTVTKENEYKLHCAINWLASCGTDNNRIYLTYMLYEIDIPTIDAIYEFCKSVMDEMSKMPIIFCLATTVDLCKTIKSDLIN